MCISFFKVFNILFLRKVTKNLVLPEEKFVSLILHRNAITLQHLIIQFPLCYPSSDHLRVVIVHPYLSIFFFHFFFFHFNWESRVQSPVQGPVQVLLCPFHFLLNLKLDLENRLLCLERISQARIFDNYWLDNEQRKAAV